ncbi:YeeE/YedE family protein [Companilactobacillus suantsaicola]|uniref:YeeE/YedE family protein n=1 Tax=Companilactobacillus suantsaicola TaxID=2487723 RepID=A0A4Z0JGP6_9LACO|nr:YeeE/YedE family protein [Companilactobacillus suantsaicola]TGD22035.1 YeeE/YedE family protein [Companilactobacillus suantsaicola]
MFKDDMKKAGLNPIQPIIGIALFILAVIWALYLNTQANKLPLALFAGLMIGYSLTRSRFGFAGGIKRVFYRGEASLTNALLIMFAITAIVNIGIQWFAASKGALPAWLVTNDTQSIIPGTQNVRLGNISTALGGFLFGIGMMLAGGCASGTLTDFGEGEGHSWIALPFFVLFAAPGQKLGYDLDQTSFGKIGIKGWLPDYVGYGGAIAITLLIFLGLYYIAKQYENHKKEIGMYSFPKSDYLDFEKPLPETKESVKPFSWRTYHKFFVERWSFLTGAVGIAIGAIFVLVTTGKAWGVTTAFVSLDQKFFQLFGVQFTSPAFDETAKAMQGSLLVDGGTIRNIGLVLGAFIAFLMAGRFKMNFNFSKMDMLIYGFGGALMGLGSRCARGCNIGALYSAICNFSIHGYIFMLFLVLGGMFGIKVFSGKVDILPKYVISN